MQNNTTQNSLWYFVDNAQANSAAQTSVCHDYNMTKIRHSEDGGAVYLSCGKAALLHQKTVCSKPVKARIRRSQTRFYTNS